MNRPLDIILFGASGYTGIFCIESLHKLAKINGRTFSWGVAGRSEHLLKEALRDYEKQTGEDLSSVPIIIADASDYQSLVKMTGSAKVVMNCSGPYSLFGEAVVRACLETGTHQVDVASETSYMEMIVYKYHKSASEKKVYILSACGLYSIVAELGVLFLQDKFEGTINSVECYEQFYLSLRDKMTVPYATYQSALYRIASQKESDEWKQKLNPVPGPVYQPRLKPRPFIHMSSVINQWCLPYGDSYCSSVERMQRHLSESKKIRPVQIRGYLGQQSLVRLIIFVVVTWALSFIAKCDFGRHFLLKYPHVFTGGYVTHKRPPKTSAIGAKYSLTIQADGWKEKLPDVNDGFDIPPNKRMTARLSCKGSAYELTANFMTLAAIVLLIDNDKLPGSGGVYAPGIAFMETSLKRMLQENGLRFEILK